MKMEKALEILRNENVFDEEYLCFTGIDIASAIKELEEAMKPKTCEECEWWDFNSYGIFKKCFNGKGNCVSTESSFGCNKFKPKDNA